MNKKNGEVELVIDTRFYGYLTILKAAEIFTENNHITLDGDPFERVIVTINPKSNAENIGYEFYNCMLYLIGSALKDFQS